MTIRQWVTDLQAIIAQHKTASSDLSKDSKTSVNLNSTATAAVALNISVGKTIALIQAHGMDAVALTAAIDAIDSDDDTAYLDPDGSKVSTAKEKLVDVQANAATLLSDLDTLYSKVS